MFDGDGRARFDSTRTGPAAASLGHGGVDIDASRPIFASVTGFAVRTAITALGLWVAAQLVSGIQIDPGWTIVWAALWLGVVNAVVRPIFVVLTFPITVVTLGLFLLVVNAAMLGIVAWLLEGFRIAGLASGVLGSIIVGVTGWLASWFIGPTGRYEVMVVERRG